jgi:hypothetical protein
MNKDIGLGFEYDTSISIIPKITISLKLLTMARRCHSPGKFVTGMS